MDLDGLWYRMPDEYDADALTTTSRLRNRDLESRTIVLPLQPKPNDAWSVLEHVPEADRNTLYQTVSAYVHGSSEPFLHTGRGGGYLFLDSTALSTIYSLQELFYLPFLGTFGKPTSIINASRSFSGLLGDEAHRIALLHSVPYYDVADECSSLPIGCLDA